MYLAFSVARITQGAGGMGASMPVLLDSMTEALFRTNAYLAECSATVTAITAQGITLDRTVFYPLGGGQAGDAGTLLLLSGPQKGALISIADTRKSKDADGRFDGTICHLPEAEQGAEAMAQRPSAMASFRVGDSVSARLDWSRRHKLMRFHTATHLLCHLVPHLVNGCSITPDYARLDFNMTEPLDKDRLSAALGQLVRAAHPLHIGAITEAELDANPALVKSMSVQPPRGTGSIRTVRIGEQTLIDMQPCGGTHVANTSEVGAVIVSRIEKKSASTRRVLLGFAA